MARTRPAYRAHQHARLAHASEDWSRERAHGAIRPYLFRRGVAHALTVGDLGRAGRLATDFARLQARLGERTAESDGVVDDAEAVWRTQATDTGSVAAWAAFLRERRHLLRRGRLGWPSNRILLQLGVDHAEESSVTQAAETWLRGGGCDWTWLRRAPGQRPRQPEASALLAVLEGHEDGVRGVLRLADGRVLSWSDDGYVAFWDVERRRIVLRGEQHESGANVALRSDGRIVSWCLLDTTVRVWDAEDGELLVSMEHEGNGVEWVEVLPDGRLLVCTDEELCAWDLDGDDHPVTFERHGKTRSEGAKLLTDGRLLAWGDCGTNVDETSAIQLWDSASGVRLLTIHRSARGVEALEDGRLLSGSSRGSLEVWDSSTCALLTTLKGHDGSVNGVHVLDEARLLSWSDDATLRLWDARRLACIAMLRGHRGPVTGALLLEDDRCLSWSKDGSLRVWNLRDGTTVADLLGHVGPVEGAIRLGDSRVVSWGSDLTLRVWDLQRAEAICVFEGHTQGVRAVVPVDAHRVLSASSDGTLRLWDMRRAGGLRERVGHTQYIFGTAVLPGARVASWSGTTDSSEDRWLVADTTVRLWDAEGRCYAELRRPSWSDATGRVHTETENLRGVVGLPPAPVPPAPSHHEESASWGREGRVLGWTQRAAYTWDLASGQSLAVFPFPAALVGAWGEKVAALPVLADGRFFARDRSGVCATWKDDPDALGATCVLPLFPGGTTSVRVIPGTEGGVLAWSREHPPVAWDEARGARTLDVGVIHEIVPCPVDGPGGPCVVAWRHDDARLHVADVDTGASLGVLEGHVADVRGACFLPDGRLLSWSADATLRTWDVRSLAPLGVLAQVEGELEEVTVLGDGRIFTTTDAEHSAVFVWDGASGARRARFDARDLDEAAVDPWRLMFPGDEGRDAGLSTLERDYTIARASPACRRGDIACDARMGLVRLLGLPDGTVPWHTTGAWGVDSLVDEGQVVARANDELALLHLYHGARRVTLAEAQELQAERAYVDARPGSVRSRA